MAKISLSVEQIDSIITKITASSDEISKLWNSIKTDEIAKIQSSWIGKDCEAYVNKILEMDTQMQKAISAQRLLATTYKKAKDNILNTQQQLANSVANM